MLDAYNANPTSMRNAIISFSKFKNKNKILILSDMNELGESSKEEHISIANLIDSLKRDKFDVLYMHPNLLFISWERIKNNKRSIKKVSNNEKPINITKA